MFHVEHYLFSLYYQSFAYAEPPEYRVENLLGYDLPQQFRQRGGSLADVLRRELQRQSRPRRLPRPGKGGKRLFPPQAGGGRGSAEPAPV